jgi:hypothetical protein
MFPAPIVTEARRNTNLALRRQTGSEQDEVTANPEVRFVTAASLFDGHDAAISVMRRLIAVRPDAERAPANPQPRAEDVGCREPADTVIFAARKIGSFPLELVPLPQEPSLILLVHLEPSGSISP